MYELNILGFIVARRAEQAVHQAVQREHRHHDRTVFRRRVGDPDLLQGRPVPRHRLHRPQRGDRAPLPHRVLHCRQDGDEPRPPQEGLHEPAGQVPGHHPQPPHSRGAD